MLYIHGLLRVVTGREWLGPHRFYRVKPARILPASGVFPMKSTERRDANHAANFRLTPSLENWLPEAIVTARAMYWFPYSESLPRHFLRQWTYHQLPAA